MIISDLHLDMFDLIWISFYSPGQKCIHVVANQGYLSLLESLIQLGADINAQVKISCFFPFFFKWICLYLNHIVKPNG